MTRLTEAMGIEARGRTHLFTVDDRADTQRGVVINQAFAQNLALSPGWDPSTMAMAFGYPTPDRKARSRSVGVIPDVRYKSPHRGSGTDLLSASQAQGQIRSSGMRWRHRQP